MYLNAKYKFQMYLSTKYKIYLKYLNTSINTSVNTFSLNILCTYIKLKMR